jgi:putative transposase
MICALGKTSGGKDSRPRGAAPRLRFPPENCCVIINRIPGEGPRPVGSPMPRRPRFSTGGYVFHVLNRAVGRQAIFRTEGDYAALLHVLEEARQQVSMRLLGFCVMPNHWHLVLWPAGDDDLSDYMHWLTVTHTQRWHAFHKTAGTGPIYQGRFKSFPVEQDEHYLAMIRYVERNALRANLATRAEMWRWSSLDRKSVV